MAQSAPRAARGRVEDHVLRNSLRFLCVLCGSLTLAAQTTELRLPLRSRVEAFKGSGEWNEVRFEQAFPVRQTAILICDMWDRHWCSGATRRADALARKMAPLID